MMKLHTKILLSALLLLSAAGNAQAQESKIAELPGWNIKTNLLWDATATLNLGVEFRTGGRTSIDVPFNYNGLTFAGNRKWKHFLVQPELRLWTKETFRGHFFGLHGHYATYNFCNLPEPFSPYMQAHRFEGRLAGAGISYGYRWNFNHRWALEATVGAGYAYLSYDRFDCGVCDEKIDSGTGHYFGPTRAGVTLIFGIGGKRALKPDPGSVYIASTAPVVVQKAVAPEPEQVIPYEPAFGVSFVTPEAEAVKARHVSGTARLDFAAGRSEIVAAFRNNAAELRNIHATIESVKNNPDVTITGITITGYSSPEGTWADNKTLSERRAQSLKNHIASVHRLRADIFRVRGEGEDWAGLDSLIARSEMSDKYRMLEIIRGTDIFNGRESKLMALSGGNPYRRMKRELFPRLRRSDYSIEYTVAPFSVEKGREVFRSRPGNLSLNEMFLVANTYEPGSDDFNEVFETAARIYPDSDTANINAAAVALNRRDTVSAARYLSRVGERTAAYWNNMGLLAWLQGDMAKAVECFAKGGAPGQANAEGIYRHTRSTGR